MSAPKKLPERLSEAFKRIEAFLSKTPPQVTEALKLLEDSLIKAFPPPLEDAAALAAALRNKVASLRAGDLAARAACYAVPWEPWRPGFDHVAFWPGQLAELDARMPRGDALRIAMAYLLLEIERLEQPNEARAA